MKIKSGFGRIVFVFDDFVVKIPKITRISTFAFGVMENLKERYWYCADGMVYTNNKSPEWLCPLIWASSTGLVNIMKKADVLTQEDYDNAPKAVQIMFDAKLDELQNELKPYRMDSDIRYDNVGFYNGNLVTVDYGYTVRSMFYADRVMNYVTINKDNTRTYKRSLYGHYWYLKRDTKKKFKEVLEKCKKSIKKN